MELYVTLITVLYILQKEILKQCVLKIRPEGFLMSGSDERSILVVFF